MIFRIFVLAFVLPSSILSQTGWTWTELDTMPNRISNNAVTEGLDGNGNLCVYSFSGIDSTKVYSGINLNSFKYNTVTANWETIAPLPDVQGKIAASANTVKNKIYIIGGYHVNANGSEVSSSKVHIFDPVTNAYLANGTDIPIAIDDQVQVVWRDSLIYVVTGWSNTSNVPNVQIYDPANDNWLVGTSTPNLVQYKMFGASGVIIGDTIYYSGGVTSGLNFVATPYLRKGVIDANDPTQITWTLEQNNPGANGYRSAAASYKKYCFWIGGAGVSYNYNGMAYNGSGGVEPTSRILTYAAQWDTWDEGLGSPYGIMDLRGVAKISETSWIICGGMEAGQEVTNKAFLLEYDPSTWIKSNAKEEFISVYPNPASDYLILDKQYQNATFQIYSATGKVTSRGNLKSSKIDVSTLSNGSYWIIVNDEKSTVKANFIVKK